MRTAPYGEIVVTKVLSTLQLTLVVAGFPFFVTASVGQEVMKGALELDIEQVVKSNYSTLPTTVALDTMNDGSGNLFIATKLGKLKRVANGAVSDFLDLSSEAFTRSESGLLGVAFHPGFSIPTDAGYRTFYTFHSTAVDEMAEVTFEEPGNIDHHNILTEWKVNESDFLQVDQASRRELFRQQHSTSIHNAGAIEFGPDNLLYVAIGTPTPVRTSAQDKGSVLGKLLRIDPLEPSLTPGSTDAVSPNGNYRIPASNPFVNETDALGEVYALGFRNPYKISVDNQTGLVFVGDVGQGSREEVSVVQGGENMGWPYREGTISGINTPPDPAPEFTEPIAEFTHGEGGRAIIGGYLYRGSIPELYGKYLFGDLTFGSGPYTSNPGRLLYLDPFDEMGNLVDTATIEEFRMSEFSCETIDATSPADICEFDHTIYGFGLDDDGELYVLGQEGGSQGVLKVVGATELLLGDYNENGEVDLGDYNMWRDSLGQTGNFLSADGDGDFEITEADYQVWLSNYGNSSPASSSEAFQVVPEPTAESTFIACAICLVSLAATRNFSALRSES